MEQHLHVSGPLSYLRWLQIGGHILVMVGQAIILVSLIRQARIQS